MKCSGCTQFVGCRDESECLFWHQTKCHERRIYRGLEPTKHCKAGAGAGVCDGPLRCGESYIGPLCPPISPSDTAPDG